MGEYQLAKSNRWCYNNSDGTILQEVTAVDKLAYTRKEAADLAGISLPTLDALLKRPQAPIPHIRAGAKVLIPAGLFESWLEDEARRTSGRCDA